LFYWDVFLPNSIPVSGRKQAPLKIMRKLKTLFFNLWYRIRRPEMVAYWKDKDTARAKVVHREDGSYGLQVEGEKYVMPGFPRGHILFGPISKIKHIIKTAFNEAYTNLEEVMKASEHDIVPPEKMLPCVKEFWRAFEELENAEVTEDMKERVKLWKKVMCHWLNEDDAYRFRWQWLMEKIDMKKIKLTKEEKYFFRGKYFKVDHDHYDY